MATKKQQKKQLKVCFDTNVLHTQVASDLLRQEVAELLGSPIEDPNFTVRWLLPAMVRAERQYQMEQRATDLLPSLAKLERVIGHGLGITPDIVRDRIAAAVSAQLTKYNLEVIELDDQQVNWQNVIEAAVARRAPFEAGEKEKGFRDAVIVETIMQEVNRSPKSSSACVIAAVSDDRLVREALLARAKSAANVRVLADLDELRSLINTLASEVPEEYVAELVKRAAPMFWVSSDHKDTLYYTWEVDKRIKQQFGEQIERLPDDVSRIVNKITYITPTPQFVAKSGTTLTWQSRIRKNQELYRSEDSLPMGTATSMPGTTSLQTGGLISLARAIPPEQLVGTRDFVFHVRWTTRVNQRKQLTSPKLDSIGLSEIALVPAQ